MLHVHVQNVFRLDVGWRLGQKSQLQYTKKKFNLHAHVFLNYPLPPPTSK